MKLKGGGFYTQEIRKGGFRQGFSLVTLDGKVSTLAHVDLESAHRVGKYGVDVQSLEEVGVAALEEAVAAKEIVVIDEIGKMELASFKFRETVLKALNSKTLVLATIGKVDHPFVRETKSRNDTCLLEINRGNRDSMKAKIIDLIRETLKE